ncbi:primosomal protein N' [Acidaminobacter hydrogenoformans]|uniref:Replication restart protein PriA n=1 Tax=Acidaminobacter hydrogenoformans DSM 2784 TaxID=1120920 RepID=A0A1G5RSH0_9FIRM|nr:primosomal protein N' [Acidaminobacter hydrogenoformans]SCZ76967.1 replication restart DNA helicase PriA [Acidaminobacter hydrogenoformans DSM 2784]
MLHPEINPEGQKSLADVIVLKMTRALDQLFTYSIPEMLENEVVIGSKVIVPFGSGDATHEAIVAVRRAPSQKDQIEKLKSVVSVCDSAAALDERRVELALWIRARYLTNYSQAASLLLPSGTTLKRDYKIIRAEIATHEIIEALPEAEKALIDRIASKTVFQSELKENEQTLLKSIIKKGVAEKREHLTTSVRERYNRFFSLTDPGAAETWLEQIPKHQTVKRGILEMLRDYGRVEESRLKREVKATKAGLEKLEEEGKIKAETEEAFTFPTYYDSGKKNTFVAFSSEQKAAFDLISSSVINHEPEAFLLHGVTGSGKTEVYMELADLAIAEGRQVIILVPEISLTPQLVDRFRRRFGDRIAILHSRMNATQRFDQWRAIGRGDYDIVIGPRSALFAPCASVGLIVVDEAHDSSYKSDQVPKYHAVEVAGALCKLHNAPLILGSATPSLEQYHEARSGGLQLVEMHKRFSKVALPSVEIVDMRLELMSGNRSMFSRTLEEAINRALENGQQIMLLLNRKGYHTFISCRSCGYALKCPNCDVSLIFHKGQNHARCSYCHYRSSIPTVCPECGSRYFKFYGSGTEKVEEAFKEKFPDVITARMDSESISKKGALEEILERFESGEIRVLIGTQLISKGLDFANVGLVGVVLADVTLNLPDFQASERTFQLMTQVSGRSGRSKTQGRVVVQTYTPEHFALIRAAEHDYLGFYEEEMGIRKAFGYPPYLQMANIILSGFKPEDVEKSAAKLYEWLSKHLPSEMIKKGHLVILGPNPAIYSKIKNRYRWQIIIKYKEEMLTLIEEVLRKLPTQREDVRCAVDVRAISVL